MKIKSGTKVKIISGKDKGVESVVVKTMKNGNLVVKGVNLKVKHQKPNPSYNIQGGIYKKELPIDRSNVEVINEK